METSCNDRFWVFRPYVEADIQVTVIPRAIRTELGLKMTQPVSEESMATLGAQLGFHGIDRRKFMQYSATITAMLALPPAFATQVASALTAVDKPQLVWLNFQDCAGNSEALLRARDPDVATIILDLLSVDYMEVIMAASGHQAEAAKDAVLAKGGHIVVVEGSIPLNEDGIYCTIGGKTAIQILDEATKNCAAVLAIGTCATFGGLPAAKPNPTGAVGVAGLVNGKPVVNIPQCPANADNITAVIAHYLTFKSLPACDDLGRPLFAYGDRIHDNCPRRGHFDAGQFAMEFGDAGHRAGWCLYKLGCKGPSTFANCPSQMFNGHTQWPIGVGAGCVGCAEPNFWDTMTPIYDRLPRIAGMDAATTADRVGTIAAGALATGLVVHGSLKLVQHRKHGINQPEQKPEEANA
jgi:hydrogenase small subunit